METCYGRSLQEYLLSITPTGNPAPPPSNQAPPHSNPGNEHLAIATHSTDNPIVDSLVAQLVGYCINIAAAVKHLHNLQVR